MKKEALRFTFFPTAFVSNFTPLLVTLQTPLNAEPVLSEYKMWNILSVTMERFKSEDYFMSLVEIIEEFSLECECDDYLYIYVGSSEISEELLEKLSKRGYKILFYNYTSHGFKGKREEIKSLLDLLEKEGV